MIAFKIIVCLLALIAIVTGANNLWNGASVQGDFGSLGELARDPILNFTIRFLGAIWMGFGVLLILFASNIDAYKTPIIFSFLIIIIGGVGRIASIYQFGVPEGREIISYAIIAIEVVLVPALLAWLFLYDMK